MCRGVLDAHPDMPEAAALLGFLAARQLRYDEAQALLESAIARRGTVPHWHFELRQIHRRAYRLDAALAAAREAVRLDPKSARFLNGLAQVHVDRGETEQAVDAILAALALAPADPESHLSLAHYLLSEGDYRAGLTEYEWRFRSPLYRNALPTITRPTWNGMQLPGRRILLAADQGYGDAFHFARYIPMVAERCAGIVVLCRTPQIPLFRRLPGVLDCVIDITKAGEHAAFAWMASLPNIFGTTLASVPASTPYLAADPARQGYWREELARRVPDPGLRVGLVWAGNPANSGDWRRSVSLSLLAPLAKIEGVRLVSLQVPTPESDRTAMADLGITDIAPGLTDFGETAAALAGLDLLVTVDTGIAHLAGALGLPAWVLIHHPSDWRWLTGRTDSPWYPSLRLFRQPRAGDWETPIAALIAAVAALAATSGPV